MHTSGTGLLLVCQVISGIQLYDVPEREGLEGPIGLSPPAAYLYKPRGTRQTKVTTNLDTTFTLLITTLVLYKNFLLDPES